MRNLMKVGLLSALVVLAVSAVAVAASGPWTANPGTSYSNGVVTLDSEGQQFGTSYENQNLDVEVDNGDTISFEYRGECGGGAPRVFIQGGDYNTFDQDPNGTACGTDSDNDGWYEVTQTISGIAAGDAGYTGIVNDNVSDPRVIEVRNLIIAGVVIFPGSADGCKKGGWETAGYKNQGQCVSSFAKAK